MNTKLFQDIKKGDTIYWQERNKTKEGVWCCGFVMSGKVTHIFHKKDNILTLFVTYDSDMVDGFSYSYQFEVKPCVNIDYYYITEYTKFIICTNNELMPFLNAPHKPLYEEAIDAMRQHIINCIDKDICDRLKEDKKWYDKFLKK